MPGVEVPGVTITGEPDSRSEDDEFASEFIFSFSNTEELILKDKHVIVIIG